MLHFGERFRAWRKEKKVSGWLIEQRIGFARSNLSNMEHGRYIPSDEVLEQIAGIPELGLNMSILRAWKVLSEFTPEEILEALKTAFEPEELLGILNKVQEERQESPQVPPRQG